MQNVYFKHLFNRIIKIDQKAKKREKKRKDYFLGRIQLSSECIFSFIPVWIFYIYIITNYSNVCTIKYQKHKRFLFVCLFYIYYFDFNYVQV